MLRPCIMTGGTVDYSNPREGFRLLRDCGFEAVDYNIDALISTRELAKGAKYPLFEKDTPISELLEHIRPIKEAAEEFGIAITQMHAPFPIYFRQSDAINEQLLTVTEKCMAAAQYLGCPALVVHPFTSHDKTEEWEVNMNFYPRLIPCAKETGVKICLENLFMIFGTHHVRGCCSTMEEACKYIDTLNEMAGFDAFGFCYDVGHANIAANLFEMDLLTLGKRLTVLHIHDNNGAEDYHMMPYSQSGKCSVDWGKFIKGLKEIEYRGELSFETFNVSSHFPKELHPAMLKLISAEARYFRDKILAE